MARIGLLKIWRSIDEIIELLVAVRDALDPKGLRGKKITTAEAKRLSKRTVELLDALGITRD